MANIPAEKIKNNLDRARAVVKAQSAEFYDLFRYWLAADKEYTVEIGKVTHLLMFSSIVFCTLIFFWMAFFDLDIVSMTKGEVVPSSKVKSVQHLEGGIVQDILVKPGDKVTKGQTLVVLESTQTGSDVLELSVRLASLRAEIVRLEAEISEDDELVFPVDLFQKNPDIVAQSKEVFIARRDKYKNDLMTKQQQIEARTHEVEEISARLKNLQEKRKLTDERVKISEELLKDELTNRFNHLNLLSEQNDIKSRIEEDEAKLKQTESFLKGTQSELASLKNELKSTSNKELESAKQNFAELSERMGKFEDSLKRTVLTSPVEGVVKELYAVTRGGVVKPGETVVDIVPDEDVLLVEAKLPVQDIGYVKIGQLAYIRLASAEGMRFDKLDGEIIHISPDTLHDEEKKSYYLIKIQTHGSEFVKGRSRYKLYPGMQVSASVVTGERTVLQYLLGPIFYNFDGAFQER